MVLQRILETSHAGTRTHTGVKGIIKNPHDIQEINKLFIH